MGLTVAGRPTADDRVPISRTQMRNACVTFLRMEVLAALADPVRRDILLLLRNGPLAAGAVAAAFPISRPAISRHLRVLREHGLVIDGPDDNDGRGRVYRLDVAPLAELQQWLDGFRDGGRSAPLTAGLAGGLVAGLDALETEVHRARRDRSRATRSAPIVDTTRSTA